jgi:hypothetical protein
MKVTLWHRLWVAVCVATVGVLTFSIVAEALVAQDSKDTVRQTNTPCEFGVEGPVPRSTPIMAKAELTTPYIQKCFKEPGKLWGRSDAELQGFMQAIHDLGATFLIHVATPEQNTPQARRLRWIGSDGSEGGFRRFAAICKNAGLTFYLNTTISSYSKPGDFLDKQGKDLLAHPDGTYRWDVSGKLLETLVTLPEFRGFLYDECEWETFRNECDSHGCSEGDNVPTHQIHPLFAPTQNLGVRQAYEAVYQGAKRQAEKYRQVGYSMMTEQVFPVMFHTFARAGADVCPKFLKEGRDSIFAAIAVGAAKQYDREFGVAPDLWGQSGFPGHPPEELRCSLLHAYWMGAPKIFVENVYADFIEADGMRPAGLLDRHVKMDGTVNYLPSKYGEIYRWFVKEYVPAHPRPYTFRDIRPEIAIVRFDDSYWGQDYSWTPKYLYGGKDRADPASKAWIDIWHLLTHGQTSKLGISFHNGGWEGRPHDFFCALNNVVVYDHLVEKKHLKDVKLIFLTGIAVSYQTQDAVAGAVKEGAVCISLPTLAPPAVVGRGPVVQDGKGKWVLLRDYVLSDEARKEAAAFLGKPDEIRYRFGNRIMTVRRGENGNKISIYLRDEEKALRNAEPTTDSRVW